MPHLPPPPASLSELTSRAHRLAGHTLGEIAGALGWDVPLEKRRAKGWSGQLMEAALGASAASRPEADFVGLGVEMKTLPLTPQGRPLESTYVCRVPTARDVVGSEAMPRWQDSVVWHKLRHVLWVPILATHAPLAARVVGTPFLWQPTGEQARQLEADWRGHMRAVREGVVETIRTTEGVYLQVRPKGATGRSRTWSEDAEGEPILVLPRGFYLRPAFTRAILAERFALPVA